MRREIGGRSRLHRRQVQRAQPRSAELGHDLDHLDQDEGGRRTERSAARDQGELRARSRRRGHAELMASSGRAQGEVGKKRPGREVAEIGRRSHLVGLEIHRAAQRALARGKVALERGGQRVRQLEVMPLHLREIGEIAGGRGDCGRSGRSRWIGAIAGGRGRSREIGASASTQGGLSGICQGSAPFGERLGGVVRPHSLLRGGRAEVGRDRGSSGELAGSAEAR